MFFYYFYHFINRTLWNVLSMLHGMIRLPITPLGYWHCRNTNTDSFGNAKAVKDGPCQSPKLHFSYCLNFSALEISIRMSIEVKVTVIPEIALVISRDVFGVPHFFIKYCRFLQKWIYTTLLRSACMCCKYLVFAAMFLAFL